MTQSDRDLWSRQLHIIYAHWLMHGHRVTICPPAWARGALRCGVRHWRTV